MKLSLTFIFMLIFLFLFLTSCSQRKMDAFAQCLSEKGVIMFGAEWCPHCQNQKQLFGDSWRYVTYVECSLPNSEEQNGVCTHEGIRSYPTWEFPNKQRLIGVLSLPNLSQNSGCLLE